MNVRDIRLNAARLRTWDEVLDAARAVSHSIVFIRSANAVRSTSSWSSNLKLKYAYCNDKWLVLGTSGESHWVPNLNDVPNPPKVEVDGVTYKSGEITMTVPDKATEVIIPLDPVLHADGGLAQQVVGLCGLQN